MNLKKRIESYPRVCVETTISNDEEKLDSDADKLGKVANYLKRRFCSRSRWNNSCIKSYTEGVRNNEAGAHLFGTFLLLTALDA